MEQKLTKAIDDRDIIKIPMYAEILLEAGQSGAIPMPLQHRQYLEYSDSVFMDITMLKQYKEELCQFLSKSPSAKDQ